MEDEDGEVVKKYDLPPNARNTKEGESRPARQRMASMTAWTGFGPKKPEGKAGESSTTGAAQPSASQSAVRQGLARMGTWVGQKPEEDDEEDDRHIRFTIGGAGRRLTKEDFLREIQSLDPKARCEIVEQSDAPDAMKDLAKRDASKDHPGNSRLLGAKGLHSTSGGVPAAKSVAAEMAKRGGATIEEYDSEDDDGVSPGRRPIDTRPRMPKAPAPVARRQSSSPEDEYDDTRESAAERRRREQALKGVDERKPEQLSPSPEPRGRSEQVSRGRGRSPEPQEEEVYHETPAEKRRREAALGLGANGEDSDDDDTERVPPPVTAMRSRGIRFAQSPVRGKDSTRGKK